MIVNNAGIKVLLKKQGYYSHPIGGPIGGPSELQSGRAGLNRNRGSIKCGTFFKIFGIVFDFFYNRIEPIKLSASFYRWILQGNHF